MCLGNGWKDLGEQWTQIKSMQKLGTFGEHFTSWRNSLVMYQMRKKLQLRWDVITFEGVALPKWASSVCPNSFERKRMDCLGCVPSRHWQFNAPSYLILSFNFRLLLFLLLWLCFLLWSSSSSFFLPSWEWNVPPYGVHTHLFKINKVDLALCFQRMDNTILRMNHCPLDA